MPSNRSTKRKRAAAKAVHHIIELAGANSLLNLRRILQEIDITDAKVTEGRLSYPVPVAFQVSMDDYFVVSDEHEQLSRRLLFQNGTVFLTECLREAHEFLISVVNGIVRNSYRGNLGEEAVDELGGHDLRCGNKLVRADASFRPADIPGIRTVTVLVQILDSERVDHGREQALALFASNTNNVQAVVSIKILRRQRAPIAAVLGGVAPRVINQHTFSEPGFLGDAAPGVNETTPATEFLLIVYRRGQQNPQIIRFGFGSAAPYHVEDDIALVFPGVVVGGAVPGPFVANTAGFSLTLPWGDLFHVPVGGGPLPAAVAAFVANTGAGIMFDTFSILSRIRVSTRYSTRQ